MAAIFDEINFFWEKCASLLQTYPVIQNFVEITQLCMAFEIQAFLCFPYLENS